KEVDPHIRVRPVSLSTPKPEYLLGEPVILDMTLTNNTEQAVTIVKPLLHHDTDYDTIPVYISQDGKAFERFLFSPDLTDDLKREIGYIKTLEPRQSLTYQTWVLCEFRNGRKLAFDKPGTYFIRTRYSLNAGVLVHLESNVIEVKIKQPEGNDAVVWR